MIRGGEARGSAPEGTCAGERVVWDFGASPERPQENAQCVDGATQLVSWGGGRGSACLCP